MSDFWRDVLLLVAAVNPPAIALAGRARPALASRAAVATGLAVATAVTIVAALGANHFLDVLAIAPESFRIGAALVMAPVGMYTIVRASVAVDGDDAAGWRAGVFPVGISLLVGPASLAATLQASADHGAGDGFFAAIIAVAAGGAALAGARRVPGGAAGGLARLLGALLVVLAVALVVDGVRAV